MTQEGTVYLLHFDRPYRHARHYVGWTRNLDERLDTHRRGLGSRLVSVAKRAGIDFTCSRVWEGATRQRERQLKNIGKAASYCPLCRKERRAAVVLGD